MGWCYRYCPPQSPLVLSQVVVFDYSYAYTAMQVLPVAACFDRPLAKMVCFSIDNLIVTIIFGQRETYPDRLLSSALVKIGCTHVLRISSCEFIPADTNIL